MREAEAPITEVIRGRFSCRTFSDSPIDAERQSRLRAVMEGITAGPLGSPVRFQLLASSADDRGALRGLGTYGFIRGEAGFIVGAVKTGPRDFEDYGWALERIVLAAAQMKLGTCWLGGTFTRSSFSRRISLERRERLPAIAAVGVVADPRQARSTTLRRLVGADKRLPWRALFFDGGFQSPLSCEKAGIWATALEMVRLGPSASNRQPWRIVRAGAGWHFYLRRTRGYRGGVFSRLFRMNDLQRVDMGIAMYHFAAAAAEAGLPGSWTVGNPGVPVPGPLIEYVVSWVT